MRKIQSRKNIWIGSAAVLALVLLVFFIKAYFGTGNGQKEPQDAAKAVTDIWPDSYDAARPVYLDGVGERVIRWKEIQVPDWIDRDLLPVNEYSRPGTYVDDVKGIVIHYTANPGSTAKQNRDYFAGLADGASGTYASSHFIIDTDGSIIQCVPMSEVAYASNDRNHDTISIECCHEDESGKFTKATYESLVKLTAWLSDTYLITTDEIIRHYDVTGKNCPKYFVEHKDKWQEFLVDVENGR